MKTILKKIRTLVVTVAVILFSLQVFSQGWVVYTADQLPFNANPPFTKVATPPPFVLESIISDVNSPGNNLFQFADTGHGNCYYKRPISNLNMKGKGFTAVIRVKALNPTAYKAICHVDMRIVGHWWDQMVLYPATIKLNYSATTPVSLPVSTNNFNTFRMTLDTNSNVNVYINENPTPFITSSSSKVSTATFVAFGDLWSDTGGTSTSFGALIDWFAYDSTGTYAPGQGAAFPGNITVDLFTGITNVQQSSFSINPNPVANQMFIDIPDNLVNSDLIVNDILGNIVLKQKLDKITTMIDMSNLPSGIYITQVVNRYGNSISKKIIKE